MRRGKPARIIEARVMSECDGEQAARSVALEQAYVHEVYEQCAEKTAQSRQWPRIYKFLEELEPGALVCDIGCGNGKYLNFNNSIFKLGADRCKRLADIAREKENEVLICDNLALPFRDESFDAVLSIAVVHHFATTERRVNALKELARVLRIGGKLVISVWAMEQRHRKFESQDVLVPWPKAYCLNSTCNCETGLPCMNNVRRDQKTHKCILASKRIERQKNNKSKSYWIDPIFSPSPSTSSLSSPNETCYSFFRRALRKLAGGKRGGDTGSDNRPWFSESFHNNDCKNHCHNYDQDDGTDVDDIPIELRRLEDENIIINKPNDSLSVKSKSLGDIIEIQKLDLVRSRSSIPGLCSTITSEMNLNEETMSQATISNSKPRLVKQKTHLIDDTCLEIHENTAIKEIIKDLPEIPIETIPPTKLSEKRANVQKQSSMNEELMSMERLLERERVRCNIMKQASLNEEIICKRDSALENFKDSLSSGIATRHFQMLKSGLTNRIKQSTTSMEKVASISIKNGFVKILQGWTSNDSNSYHDNDEHLDDSTKVDIEKNDKTTVQASAITPTKKEPDTIERRLSKEDGSDSSKDSSLQSDTSVDSEDSFASVIYVPKKEAPQLIEITNSTTPYGYQLRTTSAPPSPRVKHPSDHHGPRLKIMSISPLLKQFPATSKSLPPPSPPGLSPRTINSFNSRPFFGPNYQNNIINQFDKFTNKPIEATTSLKVDEKSIINDESLKEDKQLKAVECEHTENVNIVKSAPAEFNSNPKDEQIVEVTENITKKSDLDVFKGYKSMSIAVNEREEVINSRDTLSLISNSDIKDNFSTESVSDEDSRRSRLNQIKELLKQKPGFATRCTKPAFPLVRRASTANAGRLETVARTLPRLLSLELFNPETDDLDSDSSGVSSPESVGSVISVISDERFIVKKENIKKEDQSEKSIDNNEQSTSNTSEETSSTAEITSSSSSSSSSSQSFRLLEAAVNVATSLETAMETVMRVRSESREFDENSGKKDILKTLSRNNNNDDDKRWNEERKRHLIDFTEKLSENLIHEIDQYCQKSCLEFNDSNIKINNTPRARKDTSVRAISNCKYNELVDNTIAWLRTSTGDNDFSENDNKLSELEPLTEVTEMITNYGDESLCLSSSSEETIDFVMVSKNGEIEDRVTNTTNNSIINGSVDKYNNIAKNNNKGFMKLGDSLDSSDIGDSIDTTVSLSDDSSNTKRLCSASTASLGSINVNYNDISVKDKRKYRYGRRSISEEIASDNRRFNEVKSDNFSESSSQESLPSDHGGGAITYHQYYHVFREGELDQLINKYVENLHIISSYYDHANWCIVAEKVQVWTI